jgi:uncharacterized damage-inducible protein DinB
MHPLLTLRYAHQTLLNSVTGLADADWDTSGVCGFWSVRQVIGHIIAWDAYFCEFIAPFAGIDAPTPHMDDFRTFGEDDDLFNDKYGTAAADKSKEELLQSLEAVYQRMVALCQQISGETWHRLNVLHWQPESDLEDYLLYAVYGHHYEHAAQIVVFRDARTPPTQPKA